MSEKATRLNIAVPGIRVDHDRPDLDGQLSAVRHGVPSIDREIEKRAFEFAGIDENRRRQPLLDDLDRNRFRQRAFQHRDDLRRQFSEIDSLRHQRLAARKSEQTLRQVRSAVGRFGDPADMSDRPIILGEIVLGHLGVDRDNLQQIVEVVGDTAAQPPDGIHLLRLAELRLERLAFRRGFDLRRDVAQLDDRQALSVVRLDRSKRDVHVDD